MGRKLERYKELLGLEHQVKGAPPERTQRLTERITASLERAKTPGQDDHDTRGTDNVQP